jgi:hypothetical protein
MAAKGRRHLPFHGDDLAVEGGGDHREGADGGGVGAGRRLRLAQVLAAQRGQDRVGLAGDVAAAGALECSGHLRPGQPGGPGRIRGLGQQLQRIRRVEVLKGLQRSGEVLPQRSAQPLHLPGTLPDQRLVGAGGHLEGRRLGAVTGHRPQLAGVGAHHPGHRVRIGLIAFGPRRAMPLPVPGHLPRVDRIDDIPGRAQRCHPQAPVGLDTDRDLTRLGVRADELADQRVQPGDPGDPFRQPRPGQHPAPLVLQLDVVMIFSPVIADKQHTSLP